MLALVDGDNFFVSCERRRAPSLMGKPIVVLSNNDGCIISRSNEVKRLGVKMGAPYFKVKHLLQQNKVHVFSCHFEYYAIVSRQLKEALLQFSPSVEIYSVDEAFVDLTGFERRNLKCYGEQMAVSILKDCQVPVSIGIAPSKTLAKVAAEFAKKENNNTPQDKVFYLPDYDTAKPYLDLLPIGDVWGIGWKLAPQLKNIGIHTAKQLAEMDTTYLAKRFGSLLARTQVELRGIPCYTVDSSHQPRKSLMFSRSFSSPVTQYKEMRQVLSVYTAKAAEKLRYDNMYAGHIGIDIMTSRFAGDSERLRRYGSIALDTPSNCTHVLTKFVHTILEQIFVPHYAYKKACVYLSDLSLEEGYQYNLFESCEKNKTLMTTLDNINQQFGRGSLRYAAEGFKRPWQSRREHSNSLTPDNNEPFKSMDGLRFL